jgi:membrane associated rhomboid family serine protease
VTGVQSLTAALGGRWSELTAGAVLTLLSGFAALFVIAAFGPDDATNGSGESTAWRRFSSKLSLRPKKIRRLNTRIWAAAIAMAVFGPLAQGAIGTATSYVLHFMPSTLSVGIAWLFGIPA